MSAEHVENGRKGGLVSGARTRLLTQRDIRQRAIGKLDLVRDDVARLRLRELVSIGYLDAWLQAIEHESYKRGYGTAYAARTRPRKAPPA